MVNDQTFMISFEDESVADSGQKVVQLRDTLLDLTPDVSAEIVKENQSTQDFGATLVLVLGAPAVVVIAKGITDYLSRTGATLTIQDRNGKVIAKNIKSTDAARIVEAFSQKKKK
jgi:hypothetical protein